MPELPEVEAIARVLDTALASSLIERVRVAGISTLKTFDPDVSSLSGRKIIAVGRRGKHLIIDAEGGLSLLIHLMSAGRLQLFDAPGSLKDKTTRVAVDLADGRQLRLREFGTKQSAWVKLLATGSLAEDPSLATLGPEAWPDPPDPRTVFLSPRPLNSAIRDQRIVSGIGRSWADEILHAARLSPFKPADGLDEEQSSSLRQAMIEKLGAAIDHYREAVGLPLPDKLPMPLQIHRHETEPCPRCGNTIEAVYFEDHTICYCPACQTGGKKLKDRRMSRLLR